jgi:hypothetical protein
MSNLRGSFGIPDVLIPASVTRTGIFQARPAGGGVRSRASCVAITSSFLKNLWAAMLGPVAKLPTTRTDEGIIMLPDCKSHRLVGLCRGSPHTHPHGDAARPGSASTQAPHSRNTVDTDLSLLPPSRSTHHARQTASSSSVAPAAKAGPADSQGNINEVGKGIVTWQGGGESQQGGGGVG